MNSERIAVTLLGVCLGFVLCLGIVNNIANPRFLDTNLWNVVQILVTIIIAWQLVYYVNVRASKHNKKLDMIASIIDDLIECEAFLYEYALNLKNNRTNVSRTKFLMLLDEPYEKIGLIDSLKNEKACTFPLHLDDLWETCFAFKRAVSGSSSWYSMELTSDNEINSIINAHGSFLREVHAFKMRLYF